MKTILIHGLGQTAGAWNKTAELLPQEDMLCPELSAFIGGGSYGELYSGFSGYLDELGPVSYTHLTLPTTFVV